RTPFRIGPVISDARSSEKLTARFRLATADCHGRAAVEPCSHGIRFAQSLFHVGLSEGLLRRRLLPSGAVVHGLLPDAIAYAFPACFVCRIFTVFNVPQSSAQGGGRADSVVLLDPLYSRVACLKSGESDENLRQLLLDLCIILDPRDAALDLAGRRAADRDELSHPAPGRQERHRALLRVARRDLHFLK